MVCSAIKLVVRTVVVMSMPKPLSGWAAPMKGEHIVASTLALLGTECEWGPRAAPSSRGCACMAMSMISIAFAMSAQSIEDSLEATEAGRSSGTRGADEAKGPSVAQFKAWEPR